MKSIRVLSMAALLSLLTIAGPVYAQEQHDEKAAEAPKAAPHPEAKPTNQGDMKSAHPDVVKPPRQEEAKPERQVQQQQQKMDQANHAQKEQQKQADKTQKDQQKQAEKTQNAQQEQAAKAQRDQQKQAKQQPREQAQNVSPAPRAGGNRGSSRIPDDKFRAHFGRGHHFRISHPTIVEGQPRFQYSGYWFEIVNPWPVNWSYDDDCYIDYVDGGYWLFDPLYPGVRVAITVVF